VSTDRLTTLDVSFLHMERPGTPLHVGSVATFEGAPLHDAGGAFRIDEIRAEVETRLDALPRLRRRLAWPPLGMARPCWVDDRDFDIERHVDVVALDGDDEDLRRYAEALMVELLPRDRPLWHLRFLTGLSGGRVALVERVHHALVDGVSGVDVAAVLLDLSADAARHAPSSWRPEAAPAGGLVVSAVRERLASPWHAARAVAAAFSHPGAVARAAADAAAGLGAALGDGLLAPRSTLNTTTGATRRLAWVATSLDHVKGAGRPLGATANDVVLTAVAEGVRHLLIGRREPVTHDASLKVLVPVSLRGDETRATLGNQVGALLLALPIGIGDVRARLEAVAAATARLKRRREAATSAAVVRAADLVPPALVGPVVRSVHSQPLVNLVVTNVPGPPFPLYAAGARMLSAFPVVPLSGNLTLGVAILSYDGTMHIGINADGERCPDLDRFRAGLEQGLAALGVASSPTGGGCREMRRVAAPG
jgi:WS/DGAT/MGAT family acyltransferase